jgi:hypothetical protein
MATGPSLLSTVFPAIEGASVSVIAVPEVGNCRKLFFHQWKLRCPNWTSRHGNRTCNLASGGSSSHSIVTADDTFNVTGGMNGADIGTDGVIPDGLSNIDEIHLKSLSIVAS